MKSSSLDLICFTVQILRCETIENRHLETGPGKKDVSQ